MHSFSEYELAGTSAVASQVQHAQRWIDPYRLNPHLESIASLNHVGATGWSTGANPKASADLKRSARVVQYALVHIRS